MGRKVLGTQYIGQGYQTSTYYAWELFLDFDTSNIPDTDALILTAADIAQLRQLIASGTAPYAGAWTYFRDAKVQGAMNASPNVDVGPTTGFSYQRETRHLASRCRRRTRATASSILKSRAGMPLF